VSVTQFSRHLLTCFISHSYKNIDVAKSHHPLIHVLLREQNLQCSEIIKMCDPHSNVAGKIFNYENLHI